MVVNLEHRMMIQLTDNRGDKFYLNSALIEIIREVMGNTSEIQLTTGTIVACMESPQKVAMMTDKV